MTVSFFLNKKKLINSLEQLPEILNLCRIFWKTFNELSQFVLGSVLFFLRPYFRRLGHFFNSFRECVHMGCLSSNKLDFFPKKYQWAQKRSFKQKITPFLPFFAHTSTWPLPFGRYWPIFQFLQEMCSFGLSCYE